MLHVKWCQKLHLPPNLLLFPSTWNCSHTNPPGFGVVFHLLGGLWDYSPVIPPDGGAGAYPGLTECSPGLCHQCEGQDTEHPPSLDHLPPPLVHRQLIFPHHILLSACSVSPSVTMASFGQVLTCVCWHGEWHLSTPKWLTLTSPVSTPRGWCLQGVSLQWVFEDRESSIFSQFHSCYPPVFHGILVIFDPKWWKSYKDVFTASCFLKPNVRPP